MACRFLLLLLLLLFLSFFSKQGLHVTALFPPGHATKPWTIGAENRTVGCETAIDLEGREGNNNRKIPSVWSEAECYHRVPL